MVTMRSISSKEPSVTVSSTTAVERARKLLADTAPLVNVHKSRPDATDRRESERTVEIEKRRQ